MMPASPHPNARVPTAVDRAADAYFDAVVAASPMTATHLGIARHQDEIDDLSLDGLREQSTLRRRALAELDGATPVDDVDRATVAVMRERLGLAEEIHTAGCEEMDLNVLASPLQEVRGTFDHMPTATADDWATIARRLARVPEALTQYRAVLDHGADRGRAPARRQVEAGIAQCERLTAPDGYFATLVRTATIDDGDLPASVRTDAEAAAGLAAEAYAATGRWLAAELHPRAPVADAVGRDHYALHSRSFLGTTIDLEETYAWGIEEVQSITAEMEQVAGEVQSGAGVEEAIAALNLDPNLQLEGTDALRGWMQDRADEAISALAGVHFDIPEPLRTLEARIAPTEMGVIYYTAPSNDFSRPGRMWWSVPAGVTTFNTWRELTTVYHEGVPGHHLQVGQGVYNQALLNRYRRWLVWCSGHGEGWALYAERLMADLGFLDDPGARLGMLDAQSLRAARVVLDIGIHCELEAPAEVGGGAWDDEKAWAYLSAHAHTDPASLRFELDRYLGWPGQAASYKVGERAWMALRDRVSRREGATFDLRDFHRRALDIGSTGLDVLSTAVLG
jgi:uncharacterized protein (DUF885 family)